MFADLSTPLVADACIRLDVDLRLAPPGIAPVLPHATVAGAVLPARHAGSVDVFLEALNDAHKGDVLVVDDGGRSDQACVGDLTALETRGAGAAGLVVWGLHRDTAELAAIGVPVFSYGTCPAGPRHLEGRHSDALISARFGEHLVTREDVVFADADGVVFVPGSRVAEVLDVASNIATTERAQARAVEDGTSLRAQLQFDRFLERRAKDPGYTFRAHLREIGGAIEE